MKNKVYYRHKFLATPLCMVYSLMVQDLLLCPIFQIFFGEKRKYLSARSLFSYPTRNKLSFRLSSCILPLIQPSLIKNLLGYGVLNKVFSFQSLISLDRLMGLERHRNLNWLNKDAWYIIFFYLNYWY